MPVMNMFPGGSTLQIPLDAPTAFAATAGNAQVELTWTDPKDKYATPEGDISDTGDQLVSEWSHTVLVRKTGSQPAGPNDGTVVVSSEVRNQYQSTPYVDTGLTNGTMYYYGVFAYNEDGVVSPGTFTSAQPQAGTPLANLAEGTLIKILENGAPVEFYLAKHNYESGLNGAGRELMVRKDVHSDRPWSSERNLNNYNGCVIDNWLNSTYKALFSSYVSDLIGETTFQYCQNSSVTYSQPLTRSFFLLSMAELGPMAGSGYDGEYLPIASQLLHTDSNGSPQPFWSRSPQPKDSLGWDVVYYTGQGGSSTQLGWNLCGARPAFTLPADTFIDNDLNLVES